jgi:hypothetical protein
VLPHQTTSSWFLKRNPLLRLCRVLRTFASTRSPLSPPCLRFLIRLCSLLMSRLPAIWWLLALRLAHIS